MRAHLLALLLGSGGGALAAQEPAVLSGRVTDAITGAPLARVQVLVEGGDPRLGTQTDSSGRYRLALAGGRAVRLRFRRIGYLPAQLEVRGGTAVGPVRLHPVSEELEATIITASRREERLSEAVIATELITARAIERSGASDVAELLGAHAGIQLDGGVSGGVGIVLQGMGAQRVLILIDGQPVVGRVGGNLDLTRLPLSTIERVEVVKGPQSTLYGSDALGGVVNLITRGSRASGSSASLSMLVGSLGRREGEGQVTADRGDWRVHLEGGGSLVSLTPGVASDAGTRSRRAHLAPRLSWGAPRDHWTASLSAVLVDESQRYRSGQLYNFSDNSQVNVQLAGQRRRGSGRMAPTLSWSRYEHLSRRATTPLPVSDSGAVDIQELLQLEVPGTFAMRGAVIDAGVALRRESIVADRVPGGRRALHAAEPYAQGSWGSGVLTYTAGSRLSVHERWGATVAPRFAMLWRPREDLALRFGGGTGFRAPDFKELYLSFANTAAGYAVEGNPDLRPERSVSGSANATLTGPRASMRLGAHVTGYRDFIETGAPDASGTYTYANVGRGTTLGVEWEGQLAVSALRLGGSYSWLHARDATSGTPLLGRAEHVASASSSLHAVGFDWGVRLHWTGATPVARDDSTGAVTVRSGFGRLDASLVRELPWGVTARLGGTNILDRVVDAGWPGFTGRQWHLGLSVGAR